MISNDLGYYKQEMLQVLLLHIVEEGRHNISIVRHVQMCFKRFWFQVCIPL